MHSVFHTRTLNPVNEQLIGIHTHTHEETNDTRKGIEEIE